MHNVRAKFLIAVLGTDGAMALAKAASRSDVLANVVVPRTVLAWLKSVDQYRGELPGIAGSYVAFHKSELGFTGDILVGDGIHHFKDESVFHTAASVAVALGVDADISADGMRDVDIERLGKSIDLLAKARMEAKHDAKTCKIGTDCKKCGLEKKAMNTPIPPNPSPPPKPVQPAAPAAAPKAPAPPKPPSTLKLTRSEAGHRCNACGLPQFVEGSFVGCVCFAALAKGVKVVDSDVSTITLSLDTSEWDRDAVVTLLEAVGRK